MLAACPLTTAKNMRLWSHCHPLGSLNISTSFFARQLKKGAVDLPYTCGFDYNRLKLIIVKEVTVFSASVDLSISCYTAWFSGTDYVVAWCKGVHNCRVPHEAPAPVTSVQTMAVASVGGQWCPVPSFELCSPPFHVWPPNNHEAVEMLCAVVDSQ